MWFNLYTFALSLKQMSTCIHGETNKATIAHRANNFWDFFSVN